MNFKINEDFLGKLMYVFAFIFLGYTLFVAVRYPFLTVDGWFTKGLLSLPLTQQISITAIDVHPPLYYLILNTVVNALDMFNVDMILSMKIASIIPYVIMPYQSKKGLRNSCRRHYGILTFDYECIF